MAPSVVSGTLGTKLNPLATPVVSFNSGNGVSLGMTATTGTTTSTALTASGTPIGGGVTGSVTTGSTKAFGAPAAAAVVGVTDPADVCRTLVFGYTTGSAMVSGTAAGVGAGVFATSPGSLTTEGWGLVDSVLDWAAPVVANVSYVRDATDRIVARSVNGVTVAKYSFTAAGDTADVTLDPSGSSIVEVTVGLPGGTVWTYRPGSLGLPQPSSVWSLSNIHGDVTVVTDQNGVKQGVTRVHDPDGNMVIGTVPDNSTGSLIMAGWVSISALSKLRAPRRTV